MKQKLLKKDLNYLVDHCYENNILSKVKVLNEFN